MSTPLPRQVQEQLDQVAELEKAMQSPPASTQEVPATEDPDQDEGESQDEAQGEGFSEHVESKPEPQENVWESKYRTLQSKYDIEVPRLHQQNRELSAQVEQVKAQMQQLAAKPQAPEPERKGSSFVSEKDESEFGTDLIDLQRRVVREQAAPLVEEITRLRNTLATLQQENGKLQQSTTQTAAGQYMNRLEKLVPDWEQINAEQAWLDWLAQVDPLTGNTRQQYLDAANAALDANRVAAIFHAYRAPRKERQSNNKDLARQVTPTRSASQPAQETHKKTWTQAELAAALDQRNLKRMRSEEVEALMAEIDAAQAEGRIR